MAIGLAVAMGVAGVIYVARFVRDTREVLARRDRPRQAWELE